MLDYIGHIFVSGAWFVLTDRGELRYYKAQKDAEPKADAIDRLGGGAGVLPAPKGTVDLSGVARRTSIERSR